MKKLVKKAKLNSSMATTAVLSLIVIAVLFQVYAEAVPEAGDAGTDMGPEVRCNATGFYWNHSDEDCRADNISGTVMAAEKYEIPLGGLMGTGGMAISIIMAGAVILIVMGALGGKK